MPRKTTFRFKPKKHSPGTTILRRICDSCGLGFVGLKKLRRHIENMTCLAENHPGVIARKATIKEADRRRQKSNLITKLGEASDVQCLEGINSVVKIKTNLMAARFDDVVEALGRTVEKSFFEQGGCLVSKNFVRRRRYPGMDVIGKHNNVHRAAALFKFGSKNFLKTVPYKNGAVGTHHVSHFCHNVRCIRHICIEKAKINFDRGCCVTNKKCMDKKNHQPNCFFKRGRSTKFRPSVIHAPLTKPEPLKRATRTYSAYFAARYSCTAHE